MPQFISSAISVLSTLYHLQASLADRDIGRIIHVSDLHLDLSFENPSGTPLSCPQNATRTNLEDSGYFGNAHCDASWNLVLSAMRAMKRICAEPDFIAWSGDSAPHVKGHRFTVDDVLSHVQNVTALFQVLYPAHKVYPAIGNHDTWPPNQISTENTALLRNLSTIWSRWIEDQDTFLKAGYYGAELSGGNKLLVLNTNLYFAHNYMVDHRLEDPGGQFEWLRNQLQKSRLDRTKVIILAHVAPGVFGYVEQKEKEFLPQYNERLVKILQDFAPEISIMLFGHSHVSNFRLVLDPTNRYPVNVILLAPSVTPSISETLSANPAFRIIDYDRSSLEILNIRQYYLDLSRANRNPADGNQTGWMEYLDYKRDYGIQAPITAETLEPFLHEIETSETEFTRYFTDLTALGDSQNAGKCENQCMTWLPCSMRFLDYDLFDRCVERRKRWVVEKWRNHQNHDPVVFTASALLILLTLFLACCLLRRHYIDWKWKDGRRLLSADELRRDFDAQCKLIDIPESETSEESDDDENSVFPLKIGQKSPNYSMLIVERPGYPPSP